MAKQESKLVLTYAYWLNSPFVHGQPGFFTGDPAEPTKGSFGGRNLFSYTVARAAEKSRELSTLVDMNFEGLARDDTMVLLLQPIQENPEGYKSIRHLERMYLDD